MLDEGDFEFYKAIVKARANNDEISIAVSALDEEGEPLINSNIQSSKSSWYEESEIVDFTWD